MFEIDKELFPLKLNYFLFFGCIGPVYGFLSTIARQLGYSIKTYGVIMMIMSILNMLMSPITGIICDKYHVKRKIYLLSITLLNIDLIIFMFIPKITPEPVAELICDTEVVLRIYHENKHNCSIFVGQNVDELITCKLNCHDVNLYDHDINNYNQSDLNVDWPMNTVNAMEIVNDYSEIDVTLKFNDMQCDENSYVFNVSSVQINGTNILLPTTCQRKFKRNCTINCSNKVLIDEVTIKTYRGNVLLRSQFWIFAIATAVFTITTSVEQTAQNTICLEILENRAENFGRQKCWGSIGWGFFSVFIGWLVDMVSEDKNEINYSPVFYSGIILTVFNLFASTKIQVEKTNKSNDQLKSVYGLLSKHYTIAFFIWAISTMFFHSIITHFLFWYMEDLVSVNNDQSQKTWLKTIQGIAQGVQCFGGEIPFFFWSGWIIRKIGHVNSMAVALGGVAVRMYLYTIISNPVWIILIELLNGVSFALGMAVKMSYTKTISPPALLNTMIGLLIFFDCLGESLGSLVGGYLFDAQGGLWSFRFFACISTLMCILNILSNTFGLTKEWKTDDFDAVPDSPMEETCNNKIT